MKFSLSRFVEIVDRVAPALLAVTPGGDKIAPLIPKIVHGIKEAQAIKGATGAEKKQRVLNAIADGAAVANATGKVKINAEQIQAIASKGIDTVIETVHVVEGAKATRPGEVATGSADASLTAGSLPGVDTLPRASDLPGGHATHGHGSADHVAPPASGSVEAADPGGLPVADPGAPPSDAFDGGADNRPPSDTDQNG